MRQTWLSPPRKNSQALCCGNGRMRAQVNQIRPAFLDVTGEFYCKIASWPIFTSIRVYAVAQLGQLSRSHCQKRCLIFRSMPEFVTHLLGLQDPADRSLACDFMSPLFHCAGFTQHSFEQGLRSHDGSSSAIAAYFDFTSKARGNNWLPICGMPTLD